VSGSDPRAPLAITLDGRTVAPDAPALPVTERGYTYGDGLFETIPLVNGRAFEPARHLDRLIASARALGLPVPDATVLERAIETTLHDAGANAGVVRVTWSRGGGGRGYAPPLPGEGRAPRLVIAAYAAPLPPAGEGGGLRLSSVRGVTPGELAGHKTLSAIHYVVAADRARAAGADDALLVDARGRVLETTVANVFAVLAGRVVTPPATLALFPGIGRARAFAASGAAEQAFDLTALSRADEAFAVSAVRGVVPIVAVDGRAIGSGAPGPLTTRLRDAS
jgi:branched-chain amino acid aminotransferase